MGDTSAVRSIGYYTGIATASVTVLAAVFLIRSAILYALWNKLVVDVLAEGMVRKITFPEAMGLALFFGMFVQGIAVVRQRA